MATLLANTLTVPEFERPIRILSQDPSRPPSANSMRRSMSEESLHKLTLPLSSEGPYTFNNMPPSPARTPTNRSQERLAPASSEKITIETHKALSERIFPLGDVKVSIATFEESTSISKEDDSPGATRDELKEYIQQTADILTNTVKDLQTLSLSETGGLEHMIAANLRLLRTLKDRHAAFDKVEHEMRTGQSRSAGPYISINRSINFDTPQFTPPQTASRIAFRDISRRTSDEMDRMSNYAPGWTQEKEDRLLELENKLKSANLAWSEDQNEYLEELDQLKEEKRKHKKRTKMERKQSIKMERSQSMSNERDHRSSFGRERASSADTKRRLSLGFVPKPLARASSSTSFVGRIFRVGK